MAEAEAIKRSVRDYIARKTFVSALQGLQSFAVLAVFGVEFTMMWGLIFVFNFNPYLGNWWSCRCRLPSASSSTPKGPGGRC